MFGQGVRLLFGWEVSNCAVEKFGPDLGSCCLSSSLLSQL